jgi:hypothetical protein
MKIKSKNRSVQGNALLLTIVATGIVGFLLAAYAGLVQSQNNAVARSQSWNATIPVVEAGVEDALSHLNKHGDDNTLVGQGWTPLGGTKYGVKRTIGNNYYIVTISNWVAGATNSTPVVESRGYVSAPSIIAGLSKSTPMVAAVGVTPQRGSSYLARGIRVTTRRPALFSKGMVAKGNINMNNHNIYADSFDSEDLSKSTGGKWDVTKRGDKGSVASNDGVINIGAADVFGNVYTGPSGSFQITSGSVGDKAWVEASRPGIQPGHYFNDMNMEFPDAKLPQSGGGATPGPRRVNGIDYDYVLDSSQFTYYNLPSVGNAKILAIGNVQLHVPGAISMTSGQSSITVAPGGSLKMYAGSSVNIGGGGVINQTESAANFFLHGLPSCTSIALKGNGTFYGVIYAPNAAMTLSGGGSGTDDFSGASITKSVTMNGHFRFHFDEALARLGIGKGFVVTSWNEMDPREVAAGPTL